MAKVNVMRVRCAPAYATDAAIQNINVDREQLVIRNAVAMIANVEAIGHGLMSDMTTLRQVAEIGNQRVNGVQGRLGHPGLSENASARQIMASRSYRVAGDRLLVDLHLFEPARRSPAFGHDAVEWLLDMAEQEPAHVALSAVVECRPVWILQSGEEVDADDSYIYELDRPESATTDLPIMRIESLWALDAVTEGALTRGMFSPNEAAFYAEEAFEFIDEWRRQFNIPLSNVRAKVAQATERYLFSRGHEETEDMATKKKLEGQGAPTEATTPAPEAAVEETPTTPDGSLDAALEQANATREERSVEPAADEAPEDGDDAPAEIGEADTSLAAAHAQIAVQNEHIATLKATVKQLVELSLLNTDNITTLHHDVRRIEGDPVVTMSVPRSRGAAVETRSAPVPPKSAALARKPQHMTERQQPMLDFDGNPDLATLQAAAARAQRR